MENSINLISEGKAWDEQYITFKALSKNFAIIREKCGLMIIYAGKGWMRDFYSTASIIGSTKKEISNLIYNANLVINSNLKHQTQSFMAIADYFLNQCVPNEQQLPEGAAFNEEYQEELKTNVSAIIKIEDKLVSLMRTELGIKQP
jgi:hypothetical protein